MSSAMAQAFPEQLYERGHADVSVRMNAAQDQLNVGWKFDDATVSGQKTSIRQPIAHVAAFTSAKFERPSPDSAGGFNLLGVAPGESTYYFPVDNLTATRKKVPFMGWSNDVDRGLLQNDQVDISLKALQASTPLTPQFSVWNISTLTPKFFISSSDGIDGNDKLSLKGHDHYFINLGKANAPGAFKATMEASARKLDGTPLRTEFDLYFLSCTPGVDCPGSAQPIPAPLGGPLSTGLIGLLMGASVFSQRRKHAC